MIHYWERDELRRGYVCVKRPITSPRNIYTCNGCGFFMSDEYLFEIKVERAPELLPVFLDAAIPVKFRV